jgi:UDP-N-acetylglucosamine/UDP-N-acetylgalactosamine 4-epimerase
MEYTSLKKHLLKNQHTWLITGVAGFIGSNILETLLMLKQKVIGLDNFSTGYRKNLQEVQEKLPENLWENFTFIHGDICHIDDCKLAMRGVDYVLHQAAMGSVVKSVEDPIAATIANIIGFVNVLTTARDANVQGFVYASSSAVYGDNNDLPTIENKIGHQLSPYAVTKYVDELYAEVFARCYDFKTIGLRYFNIFGQRQDPNGAYAAVIPKWIQSMLKNTPTVINGDGETTRDFCYIDNVVQANILAAMTTNIEALNQVYNVALNHRITLNKLFYLIRDVLMCDYPHLAELQPLYQDFRPGDVRHSQADTQKIEKLLGFHSTVDVAGGLAQSISWYKKHLS